MSRRYSTDFLIDVQKGNVSGHSMVHKFGRNDAIPNGSWAFVNLLGFTGWPLSAGTLVRVKAGGNAADTAAGNGAREITVQGLITSTLAEETDTLATAGAGASANSAKSFLRVHRAWVSSVGVYGAANTGAATIENSGGGTDLIQIGAGEGQTQFTGWSVPAGKTAYLLGLHAHVDSGKTSNIRVFTRADIDDVTAPMKSKRLKLFFDGVLGTIDYQPRGPELVIEEKSDIWVEAWGDGAVAQVSCDFELLLVDN